MGCGHVRYPRSRVDSTIRRGIEMDMKVRLSTLWIVVTFNIVFADILSFISPGFLEEVITGYAGEIQITEALLLVFAVLLEIPIAMIFLSRLL